MSCIPKKVYFFFQLNLLIRTWETDCYVILTMSPICAPPNNPRNIDHTRITQNKQVAVHPDEICGLQQFIFYSHGCRSYFRFRMQVQHDLQIRTDETMTW